VPEALRSLTYVSQTTDAMSEAAFTQLGLEAARLNALDGITGLLVFNGQRFCQTIEGSSAAIDSLLTRLEADPRHCGLQVIEDEAIPARRFRSWDMQFMALPADREAALQVARERLDSEADVAARQKIYEVVELAST
jgi:hypothetical protein